MDTDNRCFKCGKGEHEPAGESCSNPVWHVPPRVPQRPKPAEERPED